MRISDASNNQGNDTTEGSGRSAAIYRGRDADGASGVGGSGREGPLLPPPGWHCDTAVKPGAACSEDRPMDAARGRVLHASAAVAGLRQVVTVPVCGFVAFVSRDGGL